MTTRRRGCQAGMEPACERGYIFLLFLTSIGAAGSLWWIRLQSELDSIHNKWQNIMKQLRGYKQMSFGQCIQCTLHHGCPKYSTPESKALVAVLIGTKDGADGCSGDLSCSQSAKYFLWRAGDARSTASWRTSRRIWICIIATRHLLYANESVQRYAPGSRR